MPGGGPFNDHDLEPAILKVDDLLASAWTSGAAGGAEGYLAGVTLQITHSENLRLWRTQDKEPLELTYSFTANGPPSDVPDTVYVEGHDLGTGSLTVDLIAPTDANPGGEVVATDTVNFTAVHVDLDIIANGTALDETAESNPGGLVVRRADGNNAPRVDIRIEVKPDTWVGQVKLEKNSGNVAVYRSEYAPNPVTFDGSDNVFNCPFTFGIQDLYVQGVAGSNEMRDVTLTASIVGGTSSDDVRFTVLWVDPVDVSFQGAVAADNDKRDDYKYWTEADTFNLGLQKYDAIPGEELTPCWGFGFEARGLVQPPYFNYPGNDLRLDRDAEGRGWKNDGTPFGESKYFSPSIPPGNDLSADVARDDNPTDSDPYGSIYDLDVPRLIRQVAPANEVRRYRANFKEFARVTVPESATPVRCSPIRQFYVRFSMKQMVAPEGADWGVLQGIPGDNTAAYGTTPLTWNLE